MKKKNYHIKQNSYTKIPDEVYYPFGISKLKNQTLSTQCHTPKQVKSVNRMMQHTLTWLMMPNISETMAEILADFFTTECMLTFCILLWRDWSPPARYLFT